MSWTDDILKQEIEKDPTFLVDFEEEKRKLDIGVEIHQLRESLGLTQQEFAELIGKPQSTVTRIETGAMLPSFKLINEIAVKAGKSARLTFI